MIISAINLELIQPYISQTKREGMAGYSNKAEYYGAFINNDLIGFTSIQYYNKKAKFNNHYIFKEHRGNGYFKELLDFSINTVKANGCTEVIASCTNMSLNEYLKRGAIIEKEYKICTNIKLAI
jgi:predicted GNAT family acetyltransferase